MPKVNELDNAVEFLMQDLGMELTDEHVVAFQVILAEVEKLRQAEIELACLNMAGVDNWSGSEYAIELMEDYYPEEYKRRFE